MRCSEKTKCTGHSEISLRGTCLQGESQMPHPTWSMGSNWQQDDHVPGGGSWQKRDWGPVTGLPWTPPRCSYLSITTGDNVLSGITQHGVVCVCAGQKYDRKQWKQLLHPKLGASVVLHKHFWAFSKWVRDSGYNLSQKRLGKRNLWFACTPQRESTHPTGGSRASVYHRLFKRAPSESSELPSVSAHRQTPLEGAGKHPVKSLCSLKSIHDIFKKY